MCSGRSAEELSSERKALTFAKGPCNKAKNSQQANPAVSKPPRWGDVQAPGRRWGWDGSTVLGMVQECSRKETFLGRSVMLVG